MRPAVTSPARGDASRTRLHKQAFGGACSRQGARHRTAARWAPATAPAATPSSFQGPFGQNAPGDDTPISTGVRVCYQPMRAAGARARARTKCSAAGLGSSGDMRGRLKGNHKPQLQRFSKPACAGTLPGEPFQWLDGLSEGSRQQGGLRPEPSTCMQKGLLLPVRGVGRVTAAKPPNAGAGGRGVQTHAHLFMGCKNCRKYFLMRCGRF